MCIHNSRIRDGFNKGSAIVLLLADRLVVEDLATNGLPETGRGHNRLPVGAPRLLGLENPQLGESFVTGWITFVHRKQTLIVCDHRPRGVHKLLCIHFV